MADRAFEEVVADLTRIVETSRAERSALGLFPAMYRTVTVTVGEGADAGVFEDPERVRRLVAVFADRYVDAYDTHRSGGDAPLAWALAFQLAGGQFRGFANPVGGVQPRIGPDRFHGRCVVELTELLHGWATANEDAALIAHRRPGHQRAGTA